MTRRLLFFVLTIAAAPALAAAQLPTGDAVGERLVINPSTPGDLNPTDVARILGMGSISGGAGTIRPLVIDASGYLKQETNTSVTTGGNYTFGGTLAGPGGTLTIAGALAATGSMTATGTILSTAGQIDARGAVDVLDLGSDSLRMGIRSGAPTLIFNDTGSFSWDIDNNVGDLRFFRRDATGMASDLPQIPLTLAGNIIVAPRGKRILPSTPYGVDLGSQQFKFGAIWGGDLFFDTLVTIENIGTIDNRWLIGSGNILDEDLSPAAAAMITRYNNYATGTFVYLQKFARTEFLKTTSGPTLTNIISNGSFENGTVAGWSCSTNCTSVINTTLKSFHGERSMLVNVSPPPLNTLVLYSNPLVPSTTYTTCVYARRFDGAVIADGDIEIYHADGFVGVPVQPTGTDNWVRVCRTSVAGNVGGGSQNMHLNTKGVNYFLDATQTEVTSTQRPYSDFRASYTIARNQEGGVANQWYAGDGMFGAGANAGDGWIDCYAIRGIKSATEQGPACVVNVRTGAAFNDWAARAAWGNLDGIYGYSGTTYGFAAGNPSATHITLDATNGFRIRNSTTNLLHADISGNLSLTGNLTIGSGGSILGGNYTINQSGQTVGVAAAEALNAPFAYKWSGSAHGGSMYFQGYDIGTARIFTLHNDVAATKQGAINFVASTPSFSDTRLSVNASDVSNTGAVTMVAGGETLNFLYNNATATLEFAPSAFADNQIDLGRSGQRWRETWINPTTTASSLAPLVLSAGGQVLRKTNGFSGTCAVLPTVQNGIITGC